MVNTAAMIIFMMPILRVDDAVDRRVLLTCAIISTKVRRHPTGNSALTCLVTVVVVDGRFVDVLFHGFDAF